MKQTTKNQEKYKGISRDFALGIVNSIVPNLIEATYNRYILDYCLQLPYIQDYIEHSEATKIKNRYWLMALIKSI